MQHRHHAHGRSLVFLLLLIAAAGAIYSVFMQPKPAPAEATAAAATGPKKQLAVVMYSAPQCEPCDRARTWMTGHGIRFEDRDVESWPPYARELEALGSRIVPVILVNNKPQYGFFPAYIDEALANNGEYGGSDEP